MPNEKEVEEKKQKSIKSINTWKNEYDPGSGLRYSHIQHRLDSSKRQFRKQIISTITKLFWPEIKNSEFDITTHFPSVNDGLSILKKENYILYNVCNVIINKLVKYYKYMLERITYCNDGLSYSSNSIYEPINIRKLFNVLFYNKLNFTSNQALQKQLFNSKLIENKLSNLNYHPRAIGAWTGCKDKEKTLQNNLIDLDTQELSMDLMKEMKTIHKNNKRIIICRELFKKCLVYDDDIPVIFDRHFKVDYINCSLNKETEKTATMDIQIELSYKLFEKKSKQMKKQFIYDEIMKDNITNKYHMTYNINYKIAKIVGVEERFGLYYLKINMNSFVKQNKLDCGRFQNPNMIIGYNINNYIGFKSRFEDIVSHTTYYINTYRSKKEFHQFIKYNVE